VSLTEHDNVVKPFPSDRTDQPFLGAVRRSTFICCRNVRISASSAARNRKRSTTIQTMSLTRSLIPRQHRPILNQLLVCAAIILDRRGAGRERTYGQNQLQWPQLSSGLIGLRGVAMH